MVLMSKAWICCEDLSVARLLDVLRKGPRVFKFRGATYCSIEARI
jgi:hypothetical protein